MIDYLEALYQCRKIEAVWQLHCDAMGEFGFDRLMYGFTRHRYGTWYGPREDMIVLSTHDPDYTEHFIKDGLYRQTPMTRWMKRNHSPGSWSFVTEIEDDLTAEERKVIAFNREHGVVAGYTIPFPDLNIRAGGVMSLTAAPGVSQAEVDALWAGKGREIAVMNHMAHLKLISLPFENARPPLTARQREVLEWVADGKTNQDIAILIGVSSATVEKHLRLAREKLDVETTAQAVLKASFQNQIFVLEQ